LLLLQRGEAVLLRQLLQLEQQRGSSPTARWHRSCSRGAGTRAGTTKACISWCRVHRFDYRFPAPFLPLLLFLLPLLKQLLQQVGSADAVPASLWLFPSETAFQSRRLYLYLNLLQRRPLLGLLLLLVWCLCCQLGGRYCTGT
jgi:hypothetical protein